MKSALALVSAILLPGVSLADGQSSADFLLSRPPSMMVFGMARLHDALLLRKDSIGPGLPSVEYHRSSNRVVTGWNCFDCGTPPTEANCASLIRSVRFQGGVLDMTDMGPQKNESSFFASYFDPLEADEAAVPKNLAVDISSIMAVVVTITQWNLTLRCSAPLLGAGYTVEKR